MKEDILKNFEDMIDGKISSQNFNSDLKMGRGEKSNPKSDSDMFDGMDEDTVNILRKYKSDLKDALLGKNPEKLKEVKKNIIEDLAKLRGIDPDQLKVIFGNMETLYGEPPSDFNPKPKKDGDKDYTIDNIE